MSEQAQQALERNRRLIESRSPAGTPGEKTLRKYNERRHYDDGRSPYAFIRRATAKSTTVKFPFEATINGTVVTVWPDWIEWPPADHAPDPHPEDIAGGGWWSA